MRLAHLYTHVNDISEPLSRNKDNIKNMEDKTHLNTALTFAQYKATF